MKNVRMIAFAALLAGAALPAFAAEDGKTVNFINWADYIADDTAANFEAATGIHVNYDTYSSQEVLEAKMMTGQTGYDLVVTGGAVLQHQIAAGLLRPLDRAALTNYGNLDPTLMEKLATADPGNRYVVPYLWGTTGFAVNLDKVKAIFGDDVKLDSWDLLFKPENAEKLKQCGFAMLDAPAEVIPIILAYLGKNPDSTDDADLAAAEKVLQAIRPFIVKVTSTTQINDLAGGDICAAVMWSGDAAQAQARADEAGSKIKIQYVVPKEGAAVWFDSLSIPNDAPHPELAEKLINYLLQPDVIANISNTVHYANGNRAATSKVAEEIRTDPGIYPDAAVMSRLIATHPVDAATERKRTRMWQRFTTGY